MAGIFRRRWPLHGRRLRRTFLGTAANQEAVTSAVGASFAVSPQAVLLDVLGTAGGVDTALTAVLVAQDATAGAAGVGFSVSGAVAFQFSEASGVGYLASAQAVLSATATDAAGASAAFSGVLVTPAALADSAGAGFSATGAFVALAAASDAGGVGFAVAGSVIALASTSAAGGIGFSVSASIVGMRYAWPASDISEGAWLPSVGAATLASMLDEELADDADYIYADSASVCEVKLSGINDPGTSIGHRLTVRLPAGFTPRGQLLASLRQGASTQIAAWTISAPAADTNYDLDLTSGEADAITDYSDLRVRLEAATA